jgi:hypothetical protein
VDPGVGRGAVPVAVWQKGGKLFGLPLAAKATDEGAHRVITIAELLCDLLHRPLLHEDGTKGLVLTMERVSGFEEKGAVGDALHDPTSVRCGGIIIGNTDPDRMLKGGICAGKVRGEGANGGFQARNKATPRETLPRGVRIRVVASRRDSQKTPTRICENAPNLPRKWGVSPLKLWAIFAPRKSA